MRRNIRIVSVSLTATAALLANNDVIADTQKIEGFFASPKARAVIRSAVLLDPDDQAQAVDLFFLSASVSLGTENLAISISDANAQKIQGIVSMAAADYNDLISSQVCAKHDLYIPVEGTEGVLDFFVAAVCRSGTPTYAGGALKLQLAVEEFID